MQFLKLLLFPILYVLCRYPLRLSSNPLQSIFSLTVRGQISINEISSVRTITNAFVCYLFSKLDYFVHCFPLMNNHRSVEYVPRKHELHRNVYRIFICE